MAPLTLRLGRIAISARSQCTRPFVLRQCRTLRTSVFRHQEDKKDDLMDKNSMNTTSTEYSKSGGDQQASQDGTAFDPSKTSPESQLGQEESDNGGDNTLEVSPGNPEVSKPRGAQEGGSERSPNESSGSRRQSSGGGSPKKGGAGR